MTETPYEPRKRLPAAADRPVVDPADWRATDFRGEAPWVLRLSDAEAADILDAVARVEAAGLELTAIGRGDFPLGPAGDVLAAIFRELTEGVGIVQLRGLPVDRLTRRQAAIAFIGLGSHFGTLSSQNAEGHVLGHVKDLGKDYDDPMARGYQTAAAMGFHGTPGNGQTQTGPMVDLLARAARVVADEAGVLAVTVCAGFTAADIPFTGPTITVVADNNAARAREIAEDAMKVAADICVFTNHNLTIEEL